MFKALAMAMLMSAMLLTTACSNDDFAVNNDNNEIVNQKGFTIPATVNVTRQGGDTPTPDPDPEPDPTPDPTPDPDDPGGGGGGSDPNSGGGGSDPN